MKMIKYDLFVHMLEQKHLLVAGCTGSGKSVLVNGLIYTAIIDGPNTNQFILIDPKRVELNAYTRLPHTIVYASEPIDMVNALNYAMTLTETRYKYMARHRIKTYDKSDVYIIIDELADLMTTNRKQVQPIIQRLCQIGRAAKIHVIACTQSPLAKIIPTEIKVNFDSRVGLHVLTKQDSRNILDCTGLETLPQYGKGIYIYPGNMVLVDIPYIDDKTILKSLQYWRAAPKFKLF